MLADHDIKQGSCRRVLVNDTPSQAGNIGAKRLAVADLENLKTNKTQPLRRVLERDRVMVPTKCQKLLQYILTGIIYLKPCNLGQLELVELWEGSRDGEDEIPDVSEAEPEA